MSLVSCWSCRAWPPYRSGSCSLAFSERGLCGALGRRRGFVCSPRFLWELVAGAGGQAVLRPPTRAPQSRRGEGGPSPLPQRGGGRRPRGLRAGGGGVGGGRAAAPLLSLWGLARVSLPCLLSRRRCNPPRRARSVWVIGPPRAPDAACLPGGGGEEGRPLNRPPGGPVRPEPPLHPRRVGKIAGVTGDALVMGDCSGSSPCSAPSVVCAPLRRAGAGSVGRDPRGSRRRGALGRAACRSSCAPPPRRGPFLQRGGVLSAPGGAEGRRSCGSQAGGSAGGKGGGGRSAAPRPPAPSGVGLPSFVSGAPPSGILVP